MVVAWSMLLACLVAVGFGGYRLSRAGDAIAEKTGLSRSWIGLILLATVTSLPELATGISAVTVARAPDIAVGDVLGSAVFNLFILVVLDFLYRRESIYRAAAQGHVLSAGFGVVLIGLAGFSLILERAGVEWHVAHVGVHTPVMLAIYAVAMRAVFRYEQAAVPAQATAQHADTSLRRVILDATWSGVLVVAAGVALPFVASDIARLMGWSHSFVGTLLVAAVTSAPEVAVTVAALRLGALDMAIANLLGSNLFDIAVLAIDDLFYLDGSLLAAVSPAHALSALCAVMMSGVVIVGFVFRPATRIGGTIGWVSVLLFLLYLLNGYLVYLSGGQ